MATRTCHIDEFPNEVLYQIFWRILPGDLKLVRLCCKRWSSVSTARLFEQIYFAPRSEPISRFEHITRDPQLAKCVKHLIFDDTQLSKRLLRQEPHSSALEEDRMCSGSEQVAAHNTSRRHYLDQEQIRATCKDFTVLLQGLPRLSKLRKISVIGGSSHLDWPVTPPSALAQDLTGSKVAASYWSDHQENQPFYDTWGCHRVQYLFEALSSAKKSITELDIGNWQDHPRPLKTGLPLCSLVATNPMDKVRFMRNAQSVFSDLTEVSLQIDLNPRVKGRDYSERYIESLFRILSSTTKLKHLAFGVTQWGIAFNAHDTQRLLGNTWPALVSIKLRSVSVDADALLNFFERHKDTLTILYLRDVGLKQDTPYTWLDVAQRGGQLLHLDYAELDVYEWGNDSNISGWQLNSTERDLAVILGGRYEARPTGLKAEKKLQGFGCQDSECDRRERLVKWLLG